MSAILPHSAGRRPRPAQTARRPCVPSPVRQRARRSGCGAGDHRVAAGM